MSHMELLNTICSHAWQITLLVLGVIVFCKGFTRLRPRLGHLLWCVVLIKCLVPPLVTSPCAPLSWLGKRTEIGHESLERLATVFQGLIPWWSKTVTTSDTKVALQDDVAFQMITLPRTFPNMINASVTKHSNTNWIEPLFWFWSLSIGFAILLCALRYLFFVAWLKRVPSVQMDGIAQMVSPLARQVGLRSDPTIRILDAPLGPAVIGLWNPTILLPRMLIENLHRDHLQILIAHELIHIRRKDLVWAVIQVFAKALWWFHPFVWLACRRMSQECERSCDEETIQRLKCDASTYARCLLEVLEQKHRLHVAPELPGVRPVQITSCRLESIMKMKHGSRAEPKIRNALVLCVILVLALPSAKDGNGQQTEPANITATIDTQQNQPQRKPTQPESFDRTQEPAQEFNDTELVRAYALTDVLEKIVEAKWCSTNHASESLLSWLKVYEVPPPVSVPTTVSPQPAPLALKSVEAQHANAPINNLPRHPIVKHQKEIGHYEWSGENLIVRAPRSVHDQVEQRLQRAREYGFRQVIIRAEILEDRLVPPFPSAESSKDESKYHLEVLNESPEESLKALRLRSPQLIRVSAPRLATMNGERAVCSVGTQIPSIRKMNSDDSFVVPASFEATQIGFSLEATPIIKTDSTLLHLRMTRTELWPTKDANIGKTVSDENQTESFESVVMTNTVETNCNIPVGSTLVMKTTQVHPKNPSQQKILYVLIHCTVFDAEDVKSPVDK